MGLFGASCMFAPLMTYVSRWFDRRRGTAVALISSGQYIAGVLAQLIQLGWRIWLATDHDRVRADGRGRNGAARGDFSPPAAHRTGHRLAHPVPPAGTRVIGFIRMSRWHAMRRDLLLLHDDVDTHAAHGRVLQ